MTFLAEILLLIELLADDTTEGVDEEEDEDVPDEVLVVCLLRKLLSLVMGPEMSFLSIVTVVRDVLLPCLVLELQVT